jgi:hypothetical protein
VIRGAITCEILPSVRGRDEISSFASRLEEVVRHDYGTPR